MEKNSDGTVESSGMLCSETVRASISFTPLSSCLRTCWTFKLIGSKFSAVLHLEGLDTPGDRGINRSSTHYTVSLFLHSWLLSTSFHKSERGYIIECKGD